MKVIVEDTIFLDVKLKGINSYAMIERFMNTYMFHGKQWYFIGGGSVYHNVQEARCKKFYTISEREVYDDWMKTCRNKIVHYRDSMGFVMVSIEDILSSLKSEYREIRLGKLIDK